MSEDTTRADSATPSYTLDTSYTPPATSMFDDCPGFFEGYNRAEAITFAEAEEAKRSAVLPYLNAAHKRFHSIINHPGANPAWSNDDLKRIGEESLEWARKHTSPVLIGEGVPAPKQEWHYWTHLTPSTPPNTLRKGIVKLVRKFSILEDTSFSNAFVTAYLEYDASIESKYRIVWPGDENERWYDRPMRDLFQDAGIPYPLDQITKHGTLHALYLIARRMLQNKGA
jgi:hypothetical protein